MIAILCAVVSGLLGLMIIAAPMASSSGAGAKHLLSRPSRPGWTPPGAALESTPSPEAEPAAESAASAPAVTSGVWTPLNSQPFQPGVRDFYPGSAFLLTDGRVLVEDDNIQSAIDWWTLTPDHTGSYINGTWSQVASPPNCPNGFPGASADTVYAPLYYASAVLPDGRLVIIGGEYDFNYDYANPGTGEVWTNQGAIYDPVANSWACVSAPSGWTQVGDAQSVVLADGTFMIAFPLGGTHADQVATLNTGVNPPAFNNPFTPSGKVTPDGFNDEEGWESAAGQHGSDP